MFIDVAAYTGVGAWWNGAAVLHMCPSQCRTPFSCSSAADAVDTSDDRRIDYREFERAVPLFAQARALISYIRYPTFYILHAARYILPPAR